MNNIYTFLKNVCFKTNNKTEVSQTLIFVLALVLICIPLSFVFGSISCILFLFLFLVLEKNKKFNLNFALLLPVLYVFLICLSLFWSITFEETKNSLQKELVMLMFPIMFLFYKKYTKKQLYQSIEIYSFFMVAFAIIKILLAGYNYTQTKNLNVFFYHELVSLDLNAIYVAAFSSLALFYFLQLEKKNNIHQISIGILTVFIFLLSSKSIIFIDFILVIYFYIIHAKIPNGIKILTVSGAFVFVIFSLTSVKQIRERFLLEYETAFVDNTINKNIGNKDAIVYNISLKQAWKNNDFREDNYFSGAALRVYQLRIFFEMIAENNVYLTGFGHNAAQSKIKEKGIQYHLYAGYGDFNFHNQYIQTFAEIGFFGFLILILMVFINLKNAFRSKDFLHIVFAFTTFVLFITESMLCRQRGIVFFITLYCIFNTLNQSPKKIIAT
jgi:O-antigen ligase